MKKLLSFITILFLVAAPYLYCMQPPKSGETISQDQENIVVYCVSPSRALSTVLLRSMTNREGDTQ
jgi:hypothetical protein